MINAGDKVLIGFWEPRRTQGPLCVPGRQLRWPDNSPFIHRPPAAAHPGRAHGAGPGTLRPPVLGRRPRASAVPAWSGAGPAPAPRPPAQRPPESHPAGDQTPAGGHSCRMGCEGCWRVKSDRIGKSFKRDSRGSLATQDHPPGRRWQAIQTQSPYRTVTEPIAVSTCGHCVHTD